MRCGIFQGVIVFGIDGVVFLPDDVEPENSARVLVISAAVDEIFNERYFVRLVDFWEV